MSNLENKDYILRRDLDNFYLESVYFDGRWGHLSRWYTNNRHEAMRLTYQAWHTALKVMIKAKLAVDVEHSLEPIDYQRTIPVSAFMGKKS